MNNTESFFEYLIEMRKKYNLFSIERCAADVGVSSQTVRNFENRVATNTEVMIYYLSKILWETQHNEYSLALTANVNETEVIADRQNIIALLMMSYK